MEKFKIGKKWFWIGIAFAIVSPIIGIIFGICLLVEKNYRKEGLIILVCGILLLAVWNFGVRLLIKSGFFGDRECMQNCLVNCSLEAQIQKLQGEGIIPGVGQSIESFIGSTSTPEAE